MLDALGEWFAASINAKEFLGAFVAGITLHPFEKRGVLQMLDMIAASFGSTGWNRPKLYRRMQRFSIPGNYGRP